MVFILHALQITKILWSFFDWSGTSVELWLRQNIDLLEIGNLALMTHVYVKTCNAPNELNNSIHILKLKNYENS